MPHNHYQSTAGAARLCFRGQMLFFGQKYDRIGGIAHIIIVLFFAYKLPITLSVTVLLLFCSVMLATILFMFLSIGSV